MTQKAQLVKAHVESHWNCGALDMQVKMVKCHDGENQQAGQIAWQEFNSNWMWV